ncbi:hypothetical protein MAR_000647 [Mya arenaria]|uniref:Uncharacterized protein n=1 Tax=Mya arenaria TaxID=6604 RepID=A0ABY7FBR1_MYAAR|nr:hypothetical protein MAR_000647 [Mya arenaria]
MCRYQAIGETWSASQSRSAEAGLSSCMCRLPFACLMGLENERDTLERSLVNEESSKTASLSTSGLLHVSLLVVAESEMLLSPDMVASVNRGCSEASPSEDERSWETQVAPQTEQACWHTDLVSLGCSPPDGALHKDADVTQEFTKLCEVLTLIVLQLALDLLDTHSVLVPTLHLVYLVRHGCHVVMGRHQLGVAYCFSNAWTMFDTED